MTNQNTNCDYCKGVEKSAVDKSALVRLCGVLGVLTENNDLSTAALLAATRIERLEKKIPALNVDLAEASTHAYNGEIARMKLEAELARRDDIIARLKKDSDRLFVFAQHIPSCSGTCASGGFCACGLDKVIALHRALIAELEKETEK